MATNDAYALGCLVLGRSLRRVATTRKLHVMVTPGVTQQMRLVLVDQFCVLELHSTLFRMHMNAIYDTVEEVNVMDSGDEENLRLIERPDLGVTFTKLHCWKLVQYTKCVFLDADTLVGSGKKCALVVEFIFRLSHPAMSCSHTRSSRRRPILAGLTVSTAAFSSSARASRRTERLLRRHSRRAALTVCETSLSCDEQRNSQVATRAC